MEVLLVGGRKSTDYKELGKLATAVKKNLTTKGMKVREFDKEKDQKRIANLENVSCIIYTEKDGDRLQDIIDMCNFLNKHNLHINLINMATGVINKVKIPKKLKFTIVDAPNADIGILKTIKQIKKDAVQWNSEEHVAFITEAHQWSKESVPGTAKVIQDILKDIVHPQIASVRSPQISKHFQVPEEFLSGFGLHLVEIYEKKSVLNCEPIMDYRLEVLGRDSYGEGAYKIVEAMKKLENKQYLITDLVDMDII